MKRIITCSDGTWNKPGEEDGGQITQTNVQKIFQLIDKTDKENNITQIKFYDEGVGSEGNAIQRIIEGGTGAGLDEKILDAYKFSVWNFEPGDELYLFGFSRGAYTARSLAGLIRCCGIVKAYQALGIDEHREQFKPAIWTESPNVKQNNISQRLEQVWFAGAHSDVGGGYPETGLSDIALEWMIEKATDTGLSIKKTDNLKPDYKGILHNSRTGIFAITPPYYRPITLDNDITKETLNPSVTERLNDKSCNYAPENLMAAINSGNLNG